MPTRPGSPRNVAAVMAKLRQLAAGTERQLTPATKMPVNGKVLTQAKIRAQLAAALKAFQDVEDAKAALKGKLAVRAKALPGIEAWIPRFADALQGYFGSTHPALLDFGVRGRKPRRKLTAIEQTIAVANWHATRKVRNTMGPKQRKAITTAGKPGVVVLDANGKPMLGGKPPVPPRDK